MSVFSTEVITLWRRGRSLRHAAHRHTAPPPLLPLPPVTTLPTATSTRCPDHMPGNQRVACRGVGIAAGAVGAGLRRGRRCGPPVKLHACPESCKVCAVIAEGPKAAILLTSSPISPHADRVSACRASVAFDCLCTFPAAVCKRQGGQRRRPSGDPEPCSPCSHPAANPGTALQCRRSQELAGCNARAWPLHAAAAPYRRCRCRRGNGSQTIGWRLLPA